MKIRIESEVYLLRKYLGLISLVLIGIFMILTFVIPQVLNLLPKLLDVWLLSLLILGSFFTALFSEKGRLKTITLSISSLGTLVWLVLFIYVIAVRWTGNFGS